MTKQNKTCAERRTWNRESIITRPSIHGQSLPSTRTVASLPSSIVYSFPIVVLVPVPVQPYCTLHLYRFCNVHQVLYRYCTVPYCSVLQVVTIPGIIPGTVQYRQVIRDRNAFLGVSSC